ncbi:MAG: ABC transporter substrate-binding protein [Sandaracinaceae bacterium]|nr:ABC transporter substrate-binding protein [Sandaracinaceae bacterium]
MITLRKGIRHHPSPFLSAQRRVEAEDLRYAIERALRPELASRAAPLFGIIEGAEAFREGKSQHVSGIEALDRHTIRFRLKAADQTFLSLLAMPFAAPLPRKAVERPGHRFALTP